MHNGSASGSIFFGRRRTCALLGKRLEAFRKGYRQNVALLGLPYIGKTRLLRNLVKEAAPSDIIPVLISFHECDAFERCARRWMAELLFGFHHAFRKPLPVTVYGFIRSLKGLIPKTLGQMRTVRKLTTKRRYEQAYQELVGLSGLLRQECGRKVLMVLDEFDRLSELGLDDPFAALGREIMLQKDTMFLVASSSPRRSFSIFRDQLALLFGNFEAIELSPFDFEESREFIAQCLPGHSLGDESERFLIRITDGHPFYLDVLLGRMRSCLSGGVGRGLDLIVEALSRELYDERGILNLHFQSRLYQTAQGRPWPLFGDVLLAVALGNKKLSEIVRFLHLRGGEVERILERLHASEQIIKQGSVFQIPDSLFKFWLAKAYYPRRFLNELSLEACELSFRAGVIRAFEESMLCDRKELRERIEELLARFRNDTVEINRRKFRCPHFSEVISRPNNGRAFPVLARNSKTRWLCQVVLGQVTEDDIHLFLEDMKRFQDPIQKKLIVGLGGIDLNAKLLAQETKIQYLDLKNLNVLLDFYDQPKMVL